ncbi:hypothetical protein ACLOJK_014318 [Asimina triloba]
MSSPSFVFILSILALFGCAQAILPSSQNPPVLDADGNTVQSGVDYHVVSAHSGGLSLGSRGEAGFPFSVVQHASDERIGKRIRFSPASSSAAVDRIIRQSIVRPWLGGDEIIRRASRRTIHESTDLNIRFSNIPSVWRMGEPDEAGQRFVTIGGEAGHPGSSTLNNWFKIKGAGVHGKHRTYIFEHCPSVCGSCKTTCSGLDISSHEGRRWLSASSHPLRVMFVRADDS